MLKARNEVDADQMGPEYNGWTNYETWAVNLWLINDPDTYDMLGELVSDPVMSIYGQANALRMLVDDSMPLTDQASMYTDLLSYAVSARVNYVEIIKAHLDDYEQIKEALEGDGGQE